MLQYVARRLLYAIPVLVGILVVTFALARLIPGDPCRSILGEKATAETCERFADTGLERHLHTGLETRYTTRETFHVHPDDPNSAVGTCAWTKQYARGYWRAVVNVSVTVCALPDTWQIDASLSASDADGIVTEKTWTEKIPRDLV